MVFRHKIKTHIFTVLAVLALMSCSLFEEGNTGSVTFRINDELAEKIKTSARQREVDSKPSFDVPDNLKDENAYFEISLKGGWQATRTVLVESGTVITFDEIPLGTELYAEAIAYILDPVTEEKQILYKGTAEKIIIKEGGNEIPLILKKQILDTTYTVRHYQQNIDDDEYTEVESDKETVEGKTGTLTEAVAKIYTGFTAKSFEQITLSEKTAENEVKIYYDRNIHTVTYSGAVEGEEITMPEIAAYRYGATVNVDFTPAWENHTLSGFTDGETTYTKDGTSSFIMGDSDVTLTAIWDEVVVLYSVRHYQQNIDDDDYTEVTEDVESLSAPAGTETGAKAKTYTGFTAKSFSQITLSETAPANEVKIYYDRNTHTVTYSDGVEGEEITMPATATYRYGATVNVDFTPAWENHTLSGFSNGETTYTKDGTASFIMGDSDVTLTAVWDVVIVSYSVRHYQQNLDDDEYTEVTADTDSLAATAGSETVAKAKSYTGFTAKSFSQITLSETAPANEVKIYYDRNIHTVTYSDGVENEEVTMPSAATYRYGATVNVDFTPARQYYTLKEITDGTTAYTTDGTTSFTMGDSDVTLTAVWERQTGTQTVTVTVNPVEDGISLSQSKEGTKVIFTATAGDASTFIWRLDGVKQSETSATFELETAGMSEGTYEVEVVSETKSATATVKIGD